MKITKLDNEKLTKALKQLAFGHETKTTTVYYNPQNKITSKAVTTTEHPPNMKAIVQILQTISETDQTGDWLKTIRKNL
jgi:hypothetical protein